MSTSLYISASRHQIEVAASVNTTTRPGAVHWRTAGNRELASAEFVIPSSYSRAGYVPAIDCLFYRAPSSLLVAAGGSSCFLNTVFIGCAVMLGLARAAGETMAITMV